MRHKEIMLIPLKMVTTLPVVHRNTPPTDQILSLRRAIQNLGNLQPIFKTRPSVKTTPPVPSPLQAHLYCKPQPRCQKLTRTWLNRGIRIGCETQRCTVPTIAIRVRIPMTDQVVTAHNQCRTAKPSQPGFPPLNPPGNHINALPKLPMHRFRHRQHTHLLSLCLTTLHQILIIYEETFLPAATINSQALRARRLLPKMTTPRPHPLNLPNPLSQTTPRLPTPQLPPQPPNTDIPIPNHPPAAPPESFIPLLPSKRPRLQRQP